MSVPQRVISLTSRATFADGLLRHCQVVFAGVAAHYPTEQIINSAPPLPSLALGSQQTPSAAERLSNEVLQRYQEVLLQALNRSLGTDAVPVTGDNGASGILQAMQNVLTLEFIGDLVSPWAELHQMREGLLEGIRQFLNPAPPPLPEAVEEIVHDQGNLAGPILHELRWIQKELGAGGLSSLAAQLGEVIQRAELAFELPRERLGGNSRHSTVPVDLKIMLREDLIQEVVGDGVRVRFELSEDLPRVQGRPAELMAVFTNLLVNAAAAMADNPPEKGKQLRVIGRMACRGEGGDSQQLYVSITIVDNGKGVQPEDLPRFFDLRHTSKPDASHHGVGLVSVGKIVREHGGVPQVESRGRGHGTSVRILLPVASEEIFNDATPPPPSPSMLRGLHIAVMDDESAMRDLMKIILEEGGAVQVHVYRNPEELVQALRDPGFQVDLVVSDCRIGGGDVGKEVARQIWTMRPRLPVILQSSSGGIQNMESLTREGPGVFIVKPLRSDSSRYIETALATIRAGWPKPAPADEQ